MNKFMTRLLAVILILAMAITGCSAPAEPEETNNGTGESETVAPENTTGDDEAVSSKDTLTVGLDREPGSLDPGDSTPSWMIHYNVSSRLITYDDDTVIQPDLAESWEQTDDVTWVFHLRQGVKFHNGEELKASDVVFSFDRLYDMPSASGAMTEIVRESIAAPDDYTFTFQTKRPYAFIESQLASNQNPLYILNRKAVESVEQNVYSHAPVGTGPYKFESWTEGDSIVLTRNDDYFGEPAKLKTIVLRIINESSSRTIDLESGGIDLATQVSANDIDRLKENENTDVYTSTGSTIRCIAFNCEDELFKDVKVRKAFNHATDVATVRDICYPASAPAVSPVAPNLLGRNTDLVQYEYDPAKAKELLAEAGYPNGVEVSFIYLANSTNNMLMELLQQMWGEAGITLKLEPTESATLSSMLNNGQYQMASVNTGTNTLDGGEQMYTLFHSSNIGDSYSRCRLSDPAVDEILDKIMTTTDTEERGALTYKAQEMVHELAPMIYIAHVYGVTGISSDLRGYNSNVSNMFRYSDFYFVEK